MPEGAAIIVLGSCGADGVPTDATLQTLAFARCTGAEARADLIAVLVSECNDRNARVRLPSGVRAILIQRSTTVPAALAAAYEGLLRERGDGIVLMPSDAGSEDIAPRLAGRLGIPCAMRCTALSHHDGTWWLRREVYGGVITGEYRLRGSRLVATLALAPADQGGVELIDAEPEIITLAPVEADRVPRLLSIRPADASGTPLEKAPRIVAGGRGLGGPEGFARVHELAAALGAEVAASRPPCDVGWIHSSRQIGITGRAVAPELYVAVGISGSPQHLSGMSGSRVIVAINRDPQAPIFRYSQYGVVGDWREVVEGMLDAVRG